jgi:TPR repeat protein
LAPVIEATRDMGDHSNAHLLEGYSYLMDVNLNYKEAARHFSIAADLNNALAMYILVPACLPTHRRVRALRWLPIKHVLGCSALRRRRRLH